MTQETIITLIKREPAGSDENGMPVYAENSVDIYAEIVGTKRNEFYAGLAAGMKPELTLRIYDFEYSKEKIVEVDGVRYQIIRTYPIDGERLELICADIAEGG